MIVEISRKWISHSILIPYDGYGQPPVTVKFVRERRSPTLKSLLETADTSPMSFMADMLVGRQIAAVLSDSEVTYLMMADGTQVTVRGLVVVEPPPKLARDEPIRRTHPK